MIVYSIIVSKERIGELINSLEEKFLFQSNDLLEQDDYLWIKEKEEDKCLIALNRFVPFHNTRLNCGCQRKEKKSFCCTVIELSAPISDSAFDELIFRYCKGGKSMLGKEIKLEETKEELMTYSDDDLYNINSWGADLPFRTIITMYDEGELLKPELQRKYVWSRTEASRFIDSILLGLPVPSIFLAKEPKEIMLIIDGFQRIMTVYDYVRGVFSGDGKIFKLSNTENINARWRGKAFAELEGEEQRRIKNTTIHAIIFEQKHPRNDTGMFQIFERINTGGRTLKPQEIRNCVYQGKCNDLLFKLNKNTSWRAILGLDMEDSRMADLELILRFFAMRELHVREEGELKQINLAKYLNKYMGVKTNTTDQNICEMEKIFINMVDKVYQIYGECAFRNLKKDSDDFATKINPAIYDAVSVATAFAIQQGYEFKDSDYVEKYISLLKNDDFRQASSSRTTNIENIKKRIVFAARNLYGVNYEW